MVESVKTGVPKGYEVGEAKANKVKSPLEKTNDLLNEQLTATKEENMQLKKRVEELELKIASMENSQTKSKIANAITTDAVVNGESTEGEVEARPAE